MIRKILCLQYSYTNIGAKFDFSLSDNVIVEITSSTLEKNLILTNEVLNISLRFTKLNVGRTTNWEERPCFKIEILNADDETVFSFLDLKNQSYGGKEDIQNFCNLSALMNQNPNLISSKSEDSTMLPRHIKMVLTIGTKDELIPLTKIDKMSPIQMLRSILNEMAFDDSEIEAGAIETIIESCVERLRRVIKVENAANILRLAQKYKVQSLIEAAAKFVADNIHEVMETSGWRLIPEHDSKQLLSTVLLSLKPRKNVEAEQD